VLSNDAADDTSMSKVFEFVAVVGMTLFLYM
jgi:hypothetical protein